jgi:hypothetical protein
MVMVGGEGYTFEAHRSGLPLFQIGGPCATMVRFNHELLLHPNLEYNSDGRNPLLYETRKTVS